MLAAALHRSGVKKLIANDERDFNGLGCLEIVTFRP